MFRVDAAGGKPVYLQIIEQVERRIAAGALEAGDALPSVRALAKQLRVNPNTVVRAYQELEHKGLIERRRGAGTFVAEGGGAAATAQQLLARRAEAYVREARELGSSRQRCLDAVEAAWDQEEADGQESGGVGEPEGSSVRPRG